jgi:hypothetical protein
MDEKFNIFIKNIQKQNSLNTFVDTILKNNISECIDDLFNKLNNYDRKLLNDITIFLIEFISNKFYLNQKEQWYQNNRRDIKAVILMILPFLDDKDNFKISRNIKSLNQILVNYNSNVISKNRLKSLSLDESIKKYFKNSNFSIGLLDENNDFISESQNLELIYHYILNNTIGLIETIKKVNGKLYINWINVVPINLEKYKEEKIYTDTINTLNKININDLDFNYNYNYKGLWPGDFYQIYRKGFYQEIKKIKWMIFCKNTSLENGKYYIQILDQKLDLSKHFIYNSFLDMPYKYQYQFSNNLDYYLNSLNNNNYYFPKIFIVYLVNNYSKKNLLTQFNNNKLKYKFKISLDYQEEDKNEFIVNIQQKIDQINLSELIQTFNLIPYEHIWEFINESLDLFKNTIYSYWLIKDNKINQDFYYLSGYINLKNIYNIAKFLSFDNNWNLMPPSYSSLTDNQKTIFWNKFNDYDLRNFNINSNLSKQIEDLNINKTTILNSIINQWNTSKIDLVFIYLITRGLLSKFESNIHLTNKNILPVKFSDRKNNISKLLRKKFINNMEDYSNSYYYLTNQKYKDLDLFINDDLKEQTYFESIWKEQFWYSFYAMDWLAQIHFFHKFIYHQILFVTGATGQGKSTQIPKLLLYATKMIDLNNTGKIVTTQPRIPPTVNNADRISLELGVPIKKITKYNKNIRTRYFYSQFKHQKESHTIDTNKHAYLRTVTDGTLLEELVNNPLLKKKYWDNKKDKYSFSTENSWDNIIIDEAHEHNKNMDLILSILKDTLVLNNSIRLIIMSATMDSDEPVYRYYYKLINDNLVYPIKYPIKSMINEKILPNSIMMDRRFHISPPGETTQYKIKENYFSNYDSLEYDKTIEDKSISVVNDICKKYPKGEILLFSLGKKEILNIVEKLNQILPIGNIALPYFSNLNIKFKEIIEKIDKKIGKIKNKKENIHLEWDYEYIEDKSVPDNIYHRAVIVATNVAEASVTIPRLTFVVDNGFAKEATFNTNTNDTKLNILPISEASRVQRKGRVGRIADGFVYYIYNKNSRTNIKPKYKITQDDLSDTILKLLSDENNPIPPVYNGYNYDFIKSLKNNQDTLFRKLDFSQFNLVEKELFEINFYLNIFKNFDRSEDFFFSFYPNKEKIKVNRYLDGYSKDIIIDLKGQFYIIHPNETYIIRNCYGHVIKYSNYNYNYNKPIPDDYMKNFIHKLIGQLFIVHVDNKFNYNLHLKSLSIKKTEYGKIVNKFIEKMKLDKESCIIILLSILLNLGDETMMVLSLLNVCRNNLLKLAKNKKKFISNFLNPKSELISLIQISRIFLDLLKPYKILDIFKIDSKLKNEYYTLVKKFQKYIENNKVYSQPPKDMIEQWDTLLSLYHEGILGFDSGFKKWLKVQKITQFSDILSKYETQIANTCKIFSLNTNNIIKTIEYFYYLKTLIYVQDDDFDKFFINDDIFESINPLKNNLQQVMVNDSNEQKIINCFMIAYFDKFVIKQNIKDTKYYYGNQLIEPDNNLISNIGPNLFFLNYDEENKKINILTNINGSQLAKTVAIYNKINISGENFDNFFKDFNNHKKNYLLFNHYLFPNIKKFYKLNY